jgi:rhodanese-related sulfurtransferase
MNETIRKDLAEAREVCPTTAHRMMGAGALIVDVREPAEVARVGYAGGDVVNIPLSQFEDRWQEIPRDRDVILACAVGERSLKATYFLMYQGYTRVMNMKPGIARWVARGFPVTGSADATAGATGGPGCCGSTAEPAAEGASCRGGGQPGTSGCC